MQIPLSQIKPSPNPIRTTWDEAKLDELAQSIKEQGLIVPIKVRPTDNAHYEIVYGHRRVEAAKRAGLYQVDAIIEGVDDTSAVIQSLIENVMREDMSDIDHAKALKKIIDLTGWSASEIDRRGITGKKNALRLMKLLDLPEDLQDEIGRTLTKRHVDHVTMRVHGHGEVEEVLRKASKENLSLPQTEKVAESIAATKDPVMRDRLLKREYDPFWHDPEMARERAEKYGDYDPMAREKDRTPPADAMWKETAEVKILLDYLGAARKMAKEAAKMDELGKFAPEARSFVASKIRAMADAWYEVAENLEHDYD